VGDGTRPKLVKRISEGESLEISLQNPRLGGNKLSRFPLIAQGTAMPATRYCGWIS
jgi:hypothetical protein